MRQRIPFRCINVDAAAELLQREDVRRFDVRDAASFATSRIDRAEHVTQANLSAFIAGTAKNMPILIYCYHGHASREYAQTFSDFGFVEVYSLDGGYQAWSRWQHAIAATPPDQALRRWLTEQGFPDDGVAATVEGLALLRDVGRKRSKT